MNTFLDHITNIYQRQQKYFSLDIFHVCKRDSINEQATGYLYRHLGVSCDYLDTANPSSNPAGLLPSFFRGVCLNEIVSLLPLTITRVFFNKDGGSNSSFYSCCTLGFGVPLADGIFSMPMQLTTSVLSFFAKLFCLLGFPKGLEAATQRYLSIHPTSDAPPS